MRSIFAAVGVLLMSCAGFAQGLNFTANTLPAGQTGFSYSQSVTVTGGTTPYTFSITSGSLPAGLTLTSSSPNFIVSGLPSAVANSQPFTVTVTDSAQPANTANQAFTLTITLGALGMVTTSPLTAGFTGTPYSQSLTAHGGLPPYTWSLSAGALPAGLTLSSAGAITGIPTATTANPGPTFTLTATDSASNSVNGQFSITVSIAVLSISTLPTLPSCLANTSYTETITATGGIPPYTWAITSGQLPAGLGFSSGVISGTPTAVGTSAFTVTVYDNNFHLASASFTLTVGGSAVTISTPTLLPSGSVGAGYSTTLTATGGVPPYTWAIVSGSLPPGIAISTGGVISGIPTVAGDYIFSVEVEDSTSLTASEAFSLTVAAGGATPRTGVISQVVAGGGWITTIWLVNRTAAPVQATVNFYADNGAALNLPLTVTQAGASQEQLASTLNKVIFPNTTLVVTTLPQTTNVEAWADVLGNGALSGFAFYSNGTVEASVPLQTEIGNSISLPFDNTNGNSTAIALVNLAGAQAAITATVWDQNGNQLAVAPVALKDPNGNSIIDSNGNGHGAFMLPTQLPITAGIRGIVQFTGNPASAQAPAGQLTGLGLLTTASGLFTSMQTMAP